jgi:hypothetical protein
MNFGLIPYRHRYCTYLYYWSVHWGCYYGTALDIVVDPQRRRFGCRESDFALQRLVERCALETERVRLIALRWHSRGSEVRVGLPVGL